MPSPFPGMDPYLEPHWGDVHLRLVVYACDQIQKRLPRDLRARVQEREFVDVPGDVEPSVYPDVRVKERGRGVTATTSLTRTAQPIIIDVEDDEPITEHFVEIIDIGSGRQVVTVIEVLSPANKRPGPGQEKYLQKHQELLDGKVSLAEIDLLRAGRSVLSVPPRKIPRTHRTTYQAIARRRWMLRKAEIYAVPLREQLPTINVPLRECDADVSLDLQAVIDRAYDDGAYADDLDYESEPTPPFPAEDAAWADALLREKGVRKEKA